MRQVRAGRDPASRVAAGSAQHRLALLEAAGLTRSAIAAKAGLSNATISRLADPSTERVSRITASSVLSLPPP
jgi:ParB-like chromosome segregation protein Spo0J